MEPQENAAKLIASAVDDARRLVALETRLFKLQLLAFGGRIRSVAVLSAIAFLLLIPALVLAALGTAVGLSDATGWSLSAGCALVAGVLAFCVAICAVWASAVWKKTEESVSHGARTANAGAGNSEHVPFAAK